MGDEVCVPDGGRLWHWVLLFLARMGRLAGLREGKASASVVIVVVVALPGHVVRRVSVSVGCVDQLSFLCLDSSFT